LSQVIIAFNFPSDNFLLYHYISNMIILFHHAIIKGIGSYCDIGMKALITIVRRVPRPFLL